MVGLIPDLGRIQCKQIHFEHDSQPDVYADYWSLQDILTNELVAYSYLRFQLNVHKIQTIVDSLYDSIYNDKLDYMDLFDIPAIKKNIWGVILKILTIIYY